MRFCGCKKVQQASDFATMIQPRSAGVQNGGQDVVLWLTRHLTSHTHLHADLLARRALGMAKYGEALHTNNGRRACVDAYQEALDLVVYLAQMDLEDGLTKPSEITLQALDLQDKLHILLDPYRGKHARED